MKSFRTYSGKGGAKEYGDQLVKELAGRSQAIMLTPAQATDALAAIQRLDAFCETTGRKVFLLSAVCGFCDAATLLPDHTPAEAATGFMRTVVSVKRKDISEAVEEFLAAEEPRNHAASGQRAQLEARRNWRNRAVLGASRTTGRTEFRHGRGAGWQNGCP